MSVGFQGQDKDEVKMLEFSKYSEKKVTIGALEETIVTKGPLRKSLR
jgi:hypothetical protein